MNLFAWAQRWGIPYNALQDLMREFRVETDPATLVPGTRTEGEIQAAIRLEATRKGKRIFRNNVGGGFLQDGSFVRWGLANDSANLNKHVKSSDLIGISGEIIAQSDVGQPRGRFIAREVKAEGWRWAGDEHELAQLRFLEIIASYGGDAAFTTTEGTL